MMCHVNHASGQSDDVTERWRWCEKSVIRQYANEAWNEGAYLLRCTKIRFCASARHPHMEKPVQKQSAFFSVAFTRTPPTSNTGIFVATPPEWAKHRRVVRKLRARCTLCFDDRVTKQSVENIELTKTHHPLFSKSTVHRRSPLTLLKCP